MGRRTKGTESSSWPTPRANKIGGEASPGFSPTLEQVVKKWPTPHSSCYTGIGSHGTGGDNLQTVVKGSLNSDWVECLMNFPVGWTDVNCDTPQDWPGWPAPLGAGMIRTPQAHNGAQGPKSKEFYDKCLRTNESSITLVDQIRHETAGQYPYEPPRVVTGQKNRAKRLKCLGNGCVPIHAFPIFAAIVEIERSETIERA